MKILKMILAAIFIIVVIVFIVNQITVRPFIATFRKLIDLAFNPGSTGPYEEVINNAREGDKIKVKVEGQEDAEITFYYPKDRNETLPVIMYIHGGGWCTGSAEGVSNFAKLLASNGYVVANVDYTLAPENPYPASTIQLAEVLNFLYEKAEDYKIDKNNIFIGGNSAGAHLSSQLGALVSDEKYAKEVGVDMKVPDEAIKGLLLFNGVYNFDTAGDCGFMFFDKLVWSYVGEKDYKNYNRIDEVSTIKHINDNYPATFITVGDIDPLEPQTLEFIDKLVELDIDYTKVLWTGQNKKLYHDYIYELDRKEAQECYEKAVEFLNKHISK